MTAENAILHKVIALCRRHSYIFKAQQLYASGLYELGPLGVELKQNICNEWWYTIVTSQGNIYGVECPSIRQELQHRQCTEIPGNRTDDVKHQGSDSCHQQADNPQYSVPSSIFRTSLYQGTLLQYIQIKDIANKQLPFGSAQKGICFRHRRQEQDADRFIFDTQELTQLCVQYYCQPNTAAQQLNSWQRHRLDWWRKYAENPSNFTATDIKTKDQVQMLDIQYKFPWGSDTVERICNRGQLPMDELLRWMQNGEVDYTGRVDAMGINQDNTKDGGTQRTLEKKELIDLLKARHGRKLTLPHTLEMTTHVEPGMLAYLLDGFSEKQGLSKSTQKGSPIRPHEVMTFHTKLAPVKVAIVIKGSATRPIQEISQYLQSEFRKANINVIELDRTLTMQEMYRKTDAMGVLFTIFVHEDTVKEGTIGIRSLGENVVQGQHITKVKEVVQRHLNHE